MKVFISMRCYSAICRTVKNNPDLETGGVILGYRKNKKWIAIENVPAGNNAVLGADHFELDNGYVNYQSNVYADLYKKPLEVLGFWHKHPKSDTRFSPKDEATNERFVSAFGTVLSGIAYSDKNHVAFSLFVVDSERCSGIFYSVKKMTRYFKYNR